MWMQPFPIWTRALWDIDRIRYRCREACSLTYHMSVVETGPSMSTLQLGVRRQPVICMQLNAAHVHITMLSMLCKLVCWCGREEGTIRSCIETQNLSWRRDSGHSGLDEQGILPSGAALVPAMQRSRSKHYDPEPAGKGKGAGAYEDCEGNLPWLVSSVLAQMPETRKMWKCFCRVLT